MLHAVIDIKNNPFIGEMSLSENLNKISENVIFGQTYIALLSKNSFFLFKMIAFIISNEDVKRIQASKPRDKDVDFLLHPKFWCFQTHAFLHILTNLFQTNYFTKSSNAL